MLLRTAMRRSPGRAPHVLRDGAVQEVGHVHVAPLERGRAGGLVGQAAEDQLLHRRHLPPVALEGLELQLHARLEAHHPVRARADRRLLEALVADLLDVLLRHDPPDRGRSGAVERDEVRPRLLQVELHAPRVEHPDLLHVLLQQRRVRAVVALEGELHVLRGHALPVVEARVGAQREVVDEAVGGDGPGFGEARGARARRHRLEQRVVDRVEGEERGDRALGLGGIEPPRGQREVHRPCHLARRRGGSRLRHPGRSQAQQERDHDEHTDEPSHGAALPGNVGADDINLFETSKAESLRRVRREKIWFSGSAPRHPEGTDSGLLCCTHPCHASRYIPPEVRRERRPSAGVSCRGV